MQAFGKLPINMVTENIDLLALSAHKIYSSKGVGALCLNPKSFPITKGHLLPFYLQPIIYGGSQENEMRPATENVAGIAALEKAIEIAQQTMKADAKQIGELRDYLIDHILAEIPDSELNGSRDNRIFNNVNGSICGSSMAMISYYYSIVMELPYLQDRLVLLIPQNLLGF